jgi:type II secretory pathway component GspD/PulD (secretin)
MKKIFLLIMLALLISSRSFCADEGLCSINFVNVPVEKVLDIYKPISGHDLVISSELKRVYGSITLKLQNATKSEARKAIEKVLLEQAGVVITPLGEKRISVTFNDALPLTPAKK